MIQNAGIVNYVSDIAPGANITIRCDNVHRFSDGSREKQLHCDLTQQWHWRGDVIDGESCKGKQFQHPHFGGGDCNSFQGDFNEHVSYKGTKWSWVLVYDVKKI